MTAKSLRARHPEALERLLDKYGRLLQGVAFHILRSHADAEEVVIDTMATAWERIGSLRDPVALRLWLLRIAVRHAAGAPPPAEARTTAGRRQSLRSLR